MRSCGMSEYFRTDRNSDIPTLSNIRQLSIGILFQEIIQILTGLCRNFLNPIGYYGMPDSPWENKQSDCGISLNPIGKPSDFVRTGRNSLKFVKFLGTEF